METEQITGKNDIEEEEADYISIADDISATHEMDEAQEPTATDLPVCSSQEHEHENPDNSKPNCCLFSNKDPAILALERNYFHVDKCIKFSPSYKNARYLLRSKISYQQLKLDFRDVPLTYLKKLHLQHNSQYVPTWMTVNEDLRKLLVLKVPIFVPMNRPRFYKDNLVTTGVDEDFDREYFFFSDWKSNSLHYLCSRAKKFAQ